MDSELKTRREGTVAVEKLIKPFCVSWIQLMGVKPRSNTAAQILPKTPPVTLVENPDRVCAVVLALCLHFSLVFLNN